MSNGPKKQNFIELKKVEGVPDDRIVTKTFLSTDTMNASAAIDWAGRWYSDLSLMESIGILRESAEKVKGGDLSEMEATLVSQVRSLDTIFCNLAHRAANAESVAYMEATLRLALKAQAQCRTTVEALQEMKYPRQAFFIGQQNIAEQQQVNNAISTHARAQENSICRNELLEASHDERLDFGASAAASETHSNLEAVGEIDRPENRRRKAGDKPKRA